MLLAGSFQLFGYGFGISFCNYKFANIFYEGSDILDMPLRFRDPRRSQVAPKKGLSSQIELRIQV